MRHFRGVRLLCFHLALAACVAAQSVNSPPAVETIIGHMVQARAENRAHLRPYEVTRDYELFLGKDTQKSTSQVTAGVTFVPPNSKKYVIEKTNGGGLGETIVRQILASEAELLKNQATTDISPANYDFRLSREEDLDRQSCFVIVLLPHRKDKSLLHGTIWVDATTYLVRRVVGEPARSPSMFLHNVHIALDYGDVSGMWLQTSSESTADVLLLGTHRMVSRDTDYQFDKLAAAAEGLPVGIPSASWIVIMRYLLTFSGLLLFASLGAFFLLVPILPIMVGATMLASLMLMFGLGLQVGRRRIPLAKITHPWDGGPHARR
jgi:hypothetical protein